MSDEYRIGEDAIDREINSITKKYSRFQNRELIRQLFTTIVKLYLDEADERDLYLANVTLKELRHVFRVFSKYRHVRKVVIFGSHKTPLKSAEYKQAQEFSEKIVKAGYMVITGGGGGIMEAGNRGANDKGFAIKIKLPLEAEPNVYVKKGEQLVNVHYFFTRKLAFIKESDATVLFPGGFGTHDEGFEVLTLLQTGKTIPRPIVMIEPKGSTYWSNWLKFVNKELLRFGYVTKDDYSLFKIVNTVDAAVKEINAFYHAYHSIKYGKPLSVIRLNFQLPEKKLKELSKKYKDILVSGEIKPSGPLSSEVRAKELLHLPRISLHFNMKSYNRLVALIKDLKP